MQLFLAADTNLATGLNGFLPPNPTQPLQIVVDPGVAPGGFDTEIVFESLDRPSLARREVPPVDLS